jgi:hypothetical protein
LTISPPARPLTTVLVLTAGLAAVLALLALPSQTLAQGRRVPCPSSAAHAGHGTHACAKARRGAKRRAKRRLARHALVKSVVLKASTPARAVEPSLASCEDASSPSRTVGGSFRCQDGSQPSCEGGANPTPSASGSSLLCPPTPGGGSAIEETGCEPGTATACAADSSEYASAAEAGCRTTGSAPGGATSFACEG